MTHASADLRHFAWLPPLEATRLFYRQPTSFARHDAGVTLAMALGATLYMPATRPAIARDLPTLASRGVISVVLCLEDAIPDDAIVAAEANLVDQLSALERRVHGDQSLHPLTFVRVREPLQASRIVERLGSAGNLLTGFVLPKFDSASGLAYLDEVARLRAVTGIPYVSMPVLESAPFLHLESRADSLHTTNSILSDFRDQVLALRLGVTDLLAMYGLRRPRDVTVYEVPLIANAIADIVNVLGRPDSGFVVTGPVWEYFAVSARLFKPQLRETPFDLRDAASLRHELVSSDIDGLIREAVLDRANGLTGKTVIHPSHVLPVHALSVVTYEEYKDAMDIVDGPEGGGVRASSFGNKMNEGKPHLAWARRTLLRAAIFGVAAPEVTVVDFLQAGDDLLSARRP